MPEIDVSLGVLGSTAAASVAFDKSLERLILLARFNEVLAIHRLYQRYIVTGETARFEAYLWKYRQEIGHKIAELYSGW